jgi:hypothetical protein
MTPDQRKTLFGLWSEIYPTLAAANPDERASRLDYAQRVLGHKDLASWNDLPPEEVTKLLAIMRRRQRRMRGEQPATGFALRYIFELAPRVYGPDWDVLLSQRLEQRPYGHYGPVSALDGRQIHMLIEELLEKCARKESPEHLSRAELSEIVERLRGELRGRFAR